MIHERGETRRENILWNKGIWEEGERKYYGMREDGERRREVFGTKEDGEKRVSLRMGEGRERGRG